MTITNNLPHLISHLLVHHGLHLFPVHSISEHGTCTCRKGRDCTSPGKHPYLNVSWTKIATTSVEKFRALAKNRLVNYAVATGKKSEVNQKYLIVVDVDDAKHPILKTLPTDTFRYKTGSGGFHYWFWSPVPVKNSVSLLANKVDIRGTGGYVVIPPSKHISGNKYELLSSEDQEIADIPQDILRALSQALDTKEKRTEQKRKSKEVPEKEMDSFVFKWWTETSIPKIKESMTAGLRVPLGIRNITLHRLLSSERAKGVSTYEQLTQQAHNYVAQFEQPETFDPKEIKNVVCSVMRYPVYNTNFENVNKNYCKWIAKKFGYDVDEVKLNNLDEKFFSGLKPCIQGGVSLLELATTRKEWYAQVYGMQDGFATYKPQLLAKKLTSLGFTRQRTNKNNIWKISLENVASETRPDTTTSGEEMPTKKKTSSAKKTPDTTPSTVEPETTLASPVAVAEEEEKLPSYELPEEKVITEGESGPIGPDGEPLTLLEEREEIIETDRKYHPNDKRYFGSESTQEIMMAQIKMFGTMTPEQAEAFANGTLLMDEERTRDFLSFLQKDDVVGVRTHMYKISNVNEDGFTGVRRTFNKFERKYGFTLPEEEVSVYDLDSALTLEACEILYRNDKPYGLDSELSYKIKIKVYTDSIGRTYVFRTGKSIEKISEEPSK